MTARIVVKRSLVIAGHKTSVSLEDAFWGVLHDAAACQGRSVAAIVAEVDRDRPEGSNLSSALRLYVLGYVRLQASLAAQWQTRAA